jgi:ribokinase/sulfofructose kinase
VNQPKEDAALSAQPTHTERPYDIIAAGGVDVDFVMQVDRLPGHGEKVLGKFVGRLPGGTVANFACAASQLGSRVASLSTVGPDEDGQQVIDGFKAFGVSTEHVLVRSDVNTHFTVILIEPSGERSIVVVPMFSEAYDEAYLEKVISQGRAFYTMPNNAELFTQMSHAARRHAVEVMIDVESTIGADRPTLERILRGVDIASFNEAGLVAISGEEPTVAGARRLLAFGPHTVVVTLGKHGALAVTATEAAQVPGWKVTVRDTTGAGDTFNAAFLTTTLRGMPLAERLAFANATAALATTGIGPRGKLPTTDEVEQFMAQAQHTDN